MFKLFWEDFHPGRVFEHGPHLVTRDDIVTFAAEFDPQPMHLDEAAGKASILGGLSASGWHTCAIYMRLLCDAFLLDSTSQGAPGVDRIYVAGEIEWDLESARRASGVPLEESVFAALERSAKEVGA